MLTSQKPFMFSFGSLVLYIFHFVYRVISACYSCVESLRKSEPLALLAPRTRIPQHLALLFVSDRGLDDEVAAGVLIECVERAVTWCRVSGIGRLTAYDQRGILVKHCLDISERVKVQEDAASDISSDVEYPLTPPLSRPLSPEENASCIQSGVVTLDISENIERKPAHQKNVLTRRHPRTEKDTHQPPLTVHLVSQQSSKPFFAATANSLLRSFKQEKSKQARSNFTLSVETLDSILQGKHGLPPPDLMILHPVVPSRYSQTPLELYGFPPWQMRLTEIYRNTDRDYSTSWFNWPRATPPSLIEPLNELEFRRALDEFAQAEMRLGR